MPLSIIGHHDINDVALISEDVGSVIFNFRLVMYSGSKSRGQVGFGDQTFGDVLLGFWGFGSLNTSLIPKKFSEIYM